MENSFVEMLFLQKHLPLPIECIDLPDIERISKTICAFLNDKGGWIVVGVDGEYNAVGLNSFEIEDKIQKEVTNNISPLPLVYVQREVYNAKNVILVTIIKGSLPPYLYRNRYYIVRDGLIVSPTPDEISRLIRDSFSVKSGWESIVNLYANLDILDVDLMNNIYQQGIVSGRLPESGNGLFAVMSELQLCNSYEIKNGAVALFAKSIKNILPQCRLRIQLMSKGKTADQFEDNLTLGGNIFYLLNETMAYFKERLPKMSIFFEDKTSRVDDYIYPMDVLDEAISNALIHRDYSDSLDEVTIFIYSDKIEITNPGYLPEKLIKSKNEVLPHGSILRNPLMAELFYIAGQMEKTGRGMDLISKRMKSLGKKLPEWTTSNNRTTLRIFNTIDKIEVNERIKAFLKEHSCDSFFTKVEYIEFFEKKPSKITAQNDIQTMINLNLCKKIGQGPSTKYQVN